ncbi:hypothetical protein SAY87_013092 [Trapa incisa]|uniref:Uncharacterized protein n=2 Tax=Trapa TaxID=22665 RepID=A0AAN7KAU2_TRANT|nr:hypothetical protein SAY86_009159 [Trapa natans]KAK4763654.1 hypothetical protein SAY87_013092 [Trapa incisa]
MEEPLPAAQASEEPSSVQSPLLASAQNDHVNDGHLQRREARDRSPEDGGDTQLDQTLQKLETFLSFLGFKQSTFFGVVLSWSAFSLVGVVLPVIVLELSDCSDCEAYQIKSFELVILASQASLAAVSLLCLSHNLRKYGIRKFLFVDRYSGHMSRYSDQYIKQIKGSVRLLVIWSLPWFLLKTAREIARAVYIPRVSWWLSIYILLALIISWTYLSLVFLSASILFHLVCNLQVIHFDDYGKLLERENDVFLFIEEHIRLRHYLSKISHRFRIFLILQFFIVTASQFVTLFQTTGYSGIITLINGGDFAVSTIVQVVGIILCLHAATRISHRAQGVAALASRWHALMTCGSSSTEGSVPRTSGNMGNSELPYTLSSLRIDYSESDLESLEYVAIPTSAQLASYMSSYHRRQAFVSYLQTNPGGITIFGWTVDRALITTIFFIELSLVTFVLGKTIAVSSS